MAKSVLAVDDSQSILQMVSFTLKGAGYQVEQAMDGQAGLDMAGKKKFDLVITDLNMPKLDGISLVQKLRSQPNYKFVPILMLTTEASNEFKAKGKSAGATGWLVKPFDPDKLLATVNKVMK